MKATNPQVQKTWNLTKENQKGVRELQESIQKDRKVMKKRSAKIDQKIRETHEGLKKARELFETQWGLLVANKSLT